MSATHVVDRNRFSWRKTLEFVPLWLLSVALLGIFFVLMNWTVGRDVDRLTVEVRELRLEVGSLGERVARIEGALALPPVLGTAPPGEPAARRQPGSATAQETD